MNRVESDLQAFLQKVMADMQLDMSDWMTKNMGNMTDFIKFTKTGGNSPQFNPYMVLDLDSKCTDEEAKERYLELMRVLHPDVSGGKTGFIATMINVAYDQIRVQRNIA